MKLKIDGVEHTFDSNRFMLSEARAIEKVCGCTFQQWSDNLQSGSMEALAALVWIVMKRSDPELRFSDVDFALDSVEIEDDDADPLEDTSN